MSSTTKTAFLVNTYLQFDGCAREALEFYRSVFGGELALQTWGDSPLPDRPGDPPNDYVMHGHLKIGTHGLMASDVPLTMQVKPQGFRVSIGTHGVDEARRVFDALAEGGTVTMPYQATFWSKGFGMVDDRFGTPWLVNCEDLDLSA